MVITIPRGSSEARSAAASDREIGTACYILHEQAAEYQGSGIGALSIKTFRFGRALYSIGRGRYAVDGRS